VTLPPLLAVPVVTAVPVPDAVVPLGVCALPAVIANSVSATPATTPPAPNINERGCTRFSFPNAMSCLPDGLLPFGIQPSRKRPQAIRSYPQPGFTALS